MLTETEAAENRSGIKKYFHDVFDIRDDMMSYEEIDQMMQENTVIHGSNMWILMLAILIASIGLNVNSTAVIIGAMLISPLMSGIITMGYSLAIRDLTLLRKSITRFGTQVIISLISSTIYFLISPLEEPSAEMIARTSPTLWDVLIAVFGGIAGMIGNTRRKKGNVIPGVAIATALMPPLCTAGYGIASMQARFLFGGFYLFLINTLFIALSTALVTIILKVPYHRHLDKTKQRKINRIIGLIVTVTVIPSIYIGAATVYNSVIDRNITLYLNEEFSFSDTQLVQSSVDKTEKTISVSLVGAPISTETIGVLENALAAHNLENYTLKVTQNFIPEVSDNENTDKITIAVQENKIHQMQSELDENRQQLASLENSVSEYEALLKNKIDCGKLALDASAIFPKLYDCSCGIMSDANSEYILLNANSDEPLLDSEVVIIENWLKTETGLQNVKASVNIRFTQEETSESDETESSETND